MDYYYVYMLLCGDGKYYVGVTSNIDARIAEHEEGNDPTAWTYGRGPFKLAYLQEFQWNQDAIAWEKQLKGWSARKKQALCEADYERIKDLSKCTNVSRSDRPERTVHDITSASTALSVTDAKKHA